MDNLINIKACQRALPLLRIYRNYITINGPACELIGLEDGRFVKFSQDLNNVDRIYVSSTITPGYLAKPRKENSKVREINCKDLVYFLQKHLDGSGTYRICEEISIDTKEGKAYEIFFKKYE